MGLQLDMGVLLNQGMKIFILVFYRKIVHFIPEYNYENKNFKGIGDKEQKYYVLISIYLANVNKNKMVG